MIRVLYHLMRADYLERVRRYSFLIVLGATVLVGYSLVPALDEPYNAFVIHGYRAYYSSAWVGTVFGVMVSTFLTLIGFYLIRDAVQRDYQTRVGEIIATTPISKSLYMLGKWLSNLAVFASILTVLSVTALVMQVVRAEVPTVDLLALLTPIWLMGLPALAVVAAIAVLFDTIPPLRGGLGHLVFLLLLVWHIASLFESPESVKPFNDFAGVSRMIVELRAELAAAGLDTTGGTTDLFEPTGGRVVERFHWGGLEWSGRPLMERLSWFGVAIAIAAAAALPFDRFDPARRRIRLRRKRKPSRKRSSKWRKSLFFNKLRDPLVRPEAPGVGSISLTPLTQRDIRYRFWTTTIAELRLMLRGRVWWWYAILVGLIVSNLVSPIAVCRDWLAPAAWLWPILLWSSMGNMESRHRVDQLVCSVPSLVRRQLPAIWAAGVMVATIATGGYGLHLVLLGEWVLVGGWIVGLVFVPSLALALGTWTNSNRLFEMLYLLLWFLGAFRSVYFLDYPALGNGAIESGIPVYYLSLTILFCVAAVLGRKRQLGVGRS